MKYLRAAIRITLFFASSLFLYSAWFIGSFAIPNKQFWRQFIFRLWARFFVYLAGVRVEVIGEKPRPPFFLVSNHLSYVDIPVLRSVVESVFVAKGEIRGWFVAGRIVSDMGMVFIDRANKRDIPRAGEEMIERLEGGEGIIVFPEGTSSRGEEVLPFNSSFFEFASRISLPVHHASISYSVDEDDAKASDSVCWWDDSTFVEHLWKFFQIRNTRAIVNFAGESVASEDRKRLAKELWDRVSDKFVPVI